MKFKNWPYWLKGGVILVIIVFLVIVFNLWIPLLTEIKACFPRSQMCGFGDAGIRFSKAILIFIIYTFIGFIVGALIGYIYGKFRKSKGVKK